jgi:outer membrane protein OmpA-like peptidoglycan-associated protein
MPDEVTASPEPAPVANGGPPPNGSGAEFAALRRLLLGPEQTRLDEIATELKDRSLTAAEMAEQLPEAIVLRNRMDSQVGLALAPTIETALRESVRRDPDDIAAAIFPVLGPAIRKAIAETMSALVRSINRAMDYAFTIRGIRWRIESWRTGVPYAQVVIRHALVYRVEQAYLIHEESGLLLSHATEPGLVVPDAGIISGMLTAIQDFVHDAFRPGEGATLRTFTVGEQTVQVETGPLAILALVIRGEAPMSVLRRQQHALETIHQQYANALAEFTGETRPFDSARPLLDDCLETVVDTGPERRTHFHWMRWMIPVAAVLLAIIVAAWRSRVRFERAVAALNDEPGLVVIDAHRGWRQWDIAGLRDPDARTPQAVLASAGFGPRSLLGRWESYLSLDSSVVVARARQALGLPTSRLSLRHGALLVAGDVPLAAVPGLQAARFPPGISSIEMGDYSVVLPPHLASLRHAILSDRVVFAVDDSRIPPDEVARIRRTASAFLVLHDSVMANSGDVVLTLLGRTDSNGSNERNASLAQWRINRVRGILAGAGVRPEHLREEVLATARPLEAPDSAQRARINRSVSYEIRISARGR